MSLHIVPRWLQGCAAALLAALLFQHYLQIGDHAISRPASSDFYKFYLSAQRLQQGYSMYWLVPAKLRQGDPCHRDTPADQVHFEHPEPSTLNLGGDAPCLGPNLNPPIFIAVIQPLALMPYNWAWWTWSAMSCAATLLSAWLLSSAFNAPVADRWLRWGWTALALLVFYPSIANFTLGQVGTMVLLLLILSWRYASEGRTVLGGFWLGMLIAVKPFFLVLIPTLILTRHWRACAMAIATALAVTALGCVIYGADEQLNYLAVANNITWLGTNWNGSWFGLFDRYFISNPGGDWPSSLPLSRTLASLCAVMTFGFCCMQIRRLARDNPAISWDAVMLIGLPMALLITPLGWAYYMPTFALSLRIAWHHIPEGAVNRKAIQLLLVLPVCMAMVPITIKPSPTPMDPADWYGVDAWYWYTAMAHLICCAACLKLGATSTRGAEAPLAFTQLGDRS